MNPFEPAHQTTHDAAQMGDTGRSLLVFSALLLMSLAFTGITLSVTPNSVGDDHGLPVRSHALLVHSCCGFVTAAIICGLKRRKIAAPSMSGIFLLATLVFLAPAFGVLCSSAIFALDGYTSVKRASTFMTIVAFTVPISYAFSLLVAYAIRVRHDRIRADINRMHDESPSRGF